MRFIDLTGKIFDNLTVLKRAHTDDWGHIYWLCGCSCGKEVLKPQLYFTRKKRLIYSCGCKDKIRKGKDLIDKKIGNLTVLRRDFKTDGDGNPYWLCRCDCGNEKIIRDDYLRYKRTKSCGCSRGTVWGLLPGEAGFNQLLFSYKKSARKRNLEFDLSDEEFKNLVTKNCHYCGSVPSGVIKNISKYSTFVFNGIDRVDNLKGYSEDNVVTCCARCNVMKRSLKKDEFVEHCILVDKFQKSKNGRLDEIRNVLEEAGLKKLVAIYRKGAESRGRYFNLSDEDFKSLIIKNCYYCGSTPSKKMKVEFEYNGIDRKDNSKGYFVENCVPCCEKCNRMKYVYKENEFTAHINLIAKHQSA